MVTLKKLSLLPVTVQNVVYPDPLILTFFFLFLIDLGECMATEMPIYSYPSWMGLPLHFNRADEFLPFPSFNLHRG